MASAYQDVSLSPNVIACAMRLSEQSLTSRIHRRQFPEPDGRGCGNAKLWRLATIRQHDPRLADRCLRVLAALESEPAQAA